MSTHIEMGGNVHGVFRARRWKMVVDGRDADGSYVCSLLNDPNTSSPANVEASNLYKDNRKEYTKRVRETVEKSWED